MADSDLTPAQRALLTQIRRGTPIRAYRESTPRVGYYHAGVRVKRADVLRLITSGLLTRRAIGTTDLADYYISDAGIAALRVPAPTEAAP